MEVKDLINCLRKFAALDPKMQVSTVLTLLEVADAEKNHKVISNIDIANKVGLKSGTSARNIHYWAEGAKDITGAYEMIRVDFHPEDRRLRSIRLTPKGKAFINQIVED